VSPALCAVLLKRCQLQSRPNAIRPRGIDRVRNGYAAVIEPGWSAWRSSAWSWSRPSRACRIGGAVRATPQSFLPEEDQGAFFAAMRLPEGAPSTDAGDRRAGRGDHQADSGVEGLLLGWSGFISSTGWPPPTSFVIRLKPYAQRTDPAQSAGAINRPLGVAAVQDAIVFSICRRSWLGQPRRQYALESSRARRRRSRRNWRSRGAAIKARIGRGQHLCRRTPQIYLISTATRPVLGIGIESSARLGHVGRLSTKDSICSAEWQVNVAETPSACRGRYQSDLCAQCRGAMVPIRALAQAAGPGPQAIIATMDSADAS